MKSAEIARLHQLQIVIDCGDEAALAAHVSHRKAARLRVAVMPVVIVLLLIAATAIAASLVSDHELATPATSPSILSDVAGPPLGGSLAHNQVSVGSNPTPATNPNAVRVDRSGQRWADGATAARETATLGRHHRAPVWLVRLAEEIAIDQDIDTRLFFAVIHTESRWRVDARGKAGEIGLMQLMPRTARSLGVDPHDVRDNLRGGAMYLRRHYLSTGNWTAALARYNGRGPRAHAYAQRVLTAWEASE